MKKAYWIAPVLVFGAFIALYMAELKDLEQEKLRLAAEQKRVREEKIEKNRKLQEEAAKKRAEEVAANNLKRKQEEERQEAEKKLFEDLNYRRNFANSEAERLKKVVDDIKKDIEAETEARKKAEETIAKLKDEKVFLAGYTSKSELNAKNLQSVLTKVNEVDNAIMQAKEAAAKLEKKG